MFKKRVNYKKAKRGFCPPFCFLVFVFVYEKAKTVALAEQSNGVDVPVIDFYSLLVKFLLALLFVLFLSFVIVRLLPSFIRYKYDRASSNIKIVEIVPISRKQSLCMVKVFDKLLLLGVTENGIDLIADLSDYYEEKDKV